MENIGEFKEDEISKYFNECINKVRNDNELDQLSKLELELYYLKKEVNVREAQKMYRDGTELLFVNIINNNIKKLDLNKSKFINYIIDMINAIQNNASDNELERIIKHYTNLEIGLAKIMVESKIISYTNQSEMINIIATKCNLNEKSNEELDKLCNIVEDVIKRLLEKAKPNLEDGDFEDYIKIMECYYNICKDFIKLEAEELPKKNNEFSKTKAK